VIWQNLERRHDDPWLTHKDENVAAASHGLCHMTQLGTRLERWLDDFQRSAMMCTMIAEQVEIAGSGKGREGWFTLAQANVSYDHPFSVPLEHALNIDFVNEARGPGARVAVELSPEAARTLAATILAVLDEAEAGGYLA
jgi:hypothetical protein